MATNGAAHGVMNGRTASKSTFVTETRQISSPTDQAQRTVANSDKQLYMTGLRGVLVIESFLWVFFQTFIPSIVSSATKGPTYQKLIRDVFSVPFWNGSFIWNFFIILAMRNAAVSFLGDPNGQVYAATVIRRIIRMVALLCVASGIATLIFSQTGVQFVEEFKTKLPNDSINAPVKVHNGLAAVNSLFNLFWLTTDFYVQAANSFWPTSTLWVASIIYYQSFTVYFLMVILPFTRPKWHLQGLFLFGLGSFWIQSWGWYSATGLFFADLTVNTTLRSSFARGIQIREYWRVPYWLLAQIFVIAGLALKYVFTVLPQYEKKLLVLHPYYDLVESKSTRSDIADSPYARLDDWLLIVGILIVVEQFDKLKNVLSLKPLVWLGQRSFSIFAAQCIIFWTAGIKLWLYLTTNGKTSSAGANAVVFVVGLFATAAFSEIFYRAIDLPSMWLARNGYRWLVS